MLLHPSKRVAGEENLEFASGSKVDARHYVDHTIEGAGPLTSRVPNEITARGSAQPVGFHENVIPDHAMFGGMRP